MNFLCFISVIKLAKDFEKANFRILATGSTYELLAKEGIKCEKVNKQYEGRPNIYDFITNGEIDIVINSPVGDESEYDDSYVRKAVIKAKIPYMTTIAAAKATIEGILDAQAKGLGEVHSLQEMHASIS